MVEFFGFDTYEPGCLNATMPQDICLLLLVITISGVLTLVRNSTDMTDIFSNLIRALTLRFIPFGFRQTSANSFIIYYTRGCLIVNMAFPATVKFVTANVPMTRMSFNIPSPEAKSGEEILSYISNQEDIEMRKLIYKALSDSD